MTNKTLGSLKISEETAETMRAAIDKYNGQNIFQITLADFRRLSYELLSQLILTDTPIPIKLK